MTVSKRIAAQLPAGVQHELKRLKYWLQIRTGRFFTGEPEFAIAADLVGPGDWVIDVGANVGHYTKRFSELAGPSGRVLAFEPVPETFALLAANVRQFAHRNVTLLNAAASDRTERVGMSIPNFASGLANYYEAHLSPPVDAGLAVMSLGVDSLGIGHRIALVKIDAEGHEASVLEGMKFLLSRDRPVLIVETGSSDVVSSLQSLGYAWEQLPGSPNLLFRPSTAQAAPGHRHAPPAQ